MNRIICTLISVFVLISSVGAQEDFFLETKSTSSQEIIDINEPFDGSIIDTSYILNPPPGPGVFFSFPDPYLDILFLEQAGVVEQNDVQNESDNLQVLSDIEAFNEIAETIDASSEEYEFSEVSGIWLQESLSPTVRSEDNFDVPQSVPASNDFTREKHLSLGNVLEIYFPASGWVFVGDSLDFHSVLYQNRKFDSDDTIFFFKAMKEGESLLRFSRYDILTDTYTEESVHVIVDFSEIELGKSIVLHYSEQKKEPEEDVKKVAVVKDLPIEVAKSSSKPTVFYDEPEIFAVEHIVKEQKDSKILLSEIQNKFTEEKQEEVLSLLQDFFASSVKNLDEAWFIQGQAYELNGPKKNILKALDSYTLLTNSYPDSMYWEKADERIRYIKRMYLQMY